MNRKKCYSFKTIRMKKIILLTMLCLSINAFAQDFDKLLTKKQYDCEDISYNSALLFEQYFTESKLDSAKSLLTYWESKCGLREPVLRAKLLLAINDNEFENLLLPEKSLNYIFNYQNRMDMAKYNNPHLYDNYKSYYGYIPINQEYDNFTKRTFENLKLNYDSADMEYLLCEFYSINHDTIFSKIQTGEYDDSPISKEYKQITNEYLKQPEFHASLILGAWIPTGGITKLGTHPEIGYQIGFKQRKFNYDLTMSFKFLNSANDYYARRGALEELELTNNFFGGHIGFDLGYDIYAKNGNEIQLTGGIAYDGFDALEQDEELDLKSATVSSYNFSLGFSYRFYITNQTYIGLRAKYNIVDYTLNEIVDFTGNPITVQLLIGNVSNYFRNNNLKSLKYPLRR